MREITEYKQKVKDSYLFLIILFSISVVCGIIACISLAFNEHDILTAIGIIAAIIFIPTGFIASIVNIIIYSNSLCKELFNFKEKESFVEAYLFRYKFAFWLSLVVTLFYTAILIIDIFTFFLIFVFCVPLIAINFVWLLLLIYSYIQLKRGKISYKDYDPSNFSSYGD